MSMSTHVVGFVPPDAKWEKMKQVWDACKAIGVSVPAEVVEFFDDRSPDPKGLEVKVPIRKWSNDYASGYEIDLDNIPEHVKTIRFYNSW